MTDVFSKSKRSQVMAAIRSSGNQATELKLAAVLRVHRISGWRRKEPVFGKPDFVFRKQRVAIFVDGCFWHGCRSHCRMPKTAKSYWNPKITRNKQRDIKVKRLLRRKGWKVVRIWEHSLKDPHSFIDRLKVMLASGQ